MAGAWSDIGGLGTTRGPVADLADWLAWWSFCFIWREFYAAIVFEDHIL
jgi:hypothetical protein